MKKNTNIKLENSMFSNEKNTLNKKLYGIDNVAYCIFFENEEQLFKFIRDSKIRRSLGWLCTLEYLGEFKGRDNVIKETFKSGISGIYSKIDEFNYDVYAENEWIMIHGNINNLYSAFDSELSNTKNQKILSMKKCF